ncbi:hypothetical protein OH77DRAFT_1411313 [Trametes cingulata]|nr:hypothetical protein OH77DRAFT_1411313 [Trametes cingulata]
MFSNGASTRTRGTDYSPDAALITYDYLVTLPDEVTFFWKRKATGATALFVLVRYLSLLSYPGLGAASMGGLTDAVRLSFSCSGVIRGQAYISVSQYLVWAAFSSMRALALSGMNYVLACIVFLLAAVPFIVNIRMIAHGLSGIQVPVLGCTVLSDATPHQQTM